MKIKLTAVKVIKNSVTNRPVSVEALVLLGKKAEEFVKQKILEAERLLQEQNNLRKTQGLREKQRIDDEIIEEVLRDASR